MDFRTPRSRRVSADPVGLPVTEVSEDTAAAQCAVVGDIDRSESSTHHLGDDQGRPIVVERHSVRNGHGRQPSAAIRQHEEQRHRGFAGLLVCGMGGVHR